MIFVTVGTHEQPFNRLIKKIDELKQDGTIEEDVIIQTGFSTYEPKYCQWSKLIPYQQMVKNVADGCVNNVPKKPRRIGGRWSVLDRLHIKQAERRQKDNAPQQEQERSRKS